MEVIVIGDKTSLAFNLFQTHKKYLPLFGIVLQLDVLFFDKKINVVCWNEKLSGRKKLVMGKKGVISTGGNPVLILDIRRGPDNESF